MKLFSTIILISALCLISCADQENNSPGIVYLSDTLFDHFKNRSKTEPHIKLQLARYKRTGDLEWITLYQSTDGKFFADYILNKDYERYAFWEEPHNMWDVFTPTRPQGFNKDSLLLENMDAVFREAFFELETNPAKPLHVYFDSPPPNMSQVLLSDSSVLFQGHEDFDWKSFDSLVAKLLN